MPNKPLSPQEEIKEGVKAHLHEVLVAHSAEDSLTGKAARIVVTEPSETGLKAYLREAFLYEWNLLAFGGGLAAGVLLGPLGGVIIPLVFAAELAYLGTLVSVPRFRLAIDSKIHKRNQQLRGPGVTEQHKLPVRPLNEILHDLQPGARVRFENLRAACLEMRGISRDVRGQTIQAQSPTQVEQILTGDLDRLLWTFLRYLISQEALERFLATTDEGAIQAQVAQTTARLEQAQAENDTRLINALTDSLATHQARLANYDQAHGNAEFVAVELDRIEGKIRAITEMAVNRQDPAYISSQVDSVVQSMKMTEQAISELNIMTGLNEEFIEPPLILEAEV